MRCAAYAYEALATRETERAGDDITNFTQRNAAMKDLINQDDRLRTLSYLRNELVHGVRGKNRKIQALMDDEGQLKAELKKMLKDYLPKKRGRTAERTENEEK